MTAAASREIAPLVEDLANGEGLSGHAAAAHIRLEK
jgi:histidinol dehydrogenase